MFGERDSDVGANGGDRAEPLAGRDEHTVAAGVPRAAPSPFGSIVGTGPSLTIGGRIQSLEHPDVFAVVAHIGHHEPDCVSNVATRNVVGVNVRMQFRDAHRFEPLAPRGRAMSEHTLMCGIRSFRERCSHVSTSSWQHLEAWGGGVDCWRDGGASHGLHALELVRSRPKCDR